MNSPILHKPVTEDARSFAETEFNVLVRYLSGHSTPEIAAHRITASINGPATAGNPTSDDNPAVAISNLWDLVILTAIQISYDHPWQDSLVTLVEWIKTLRPPSRPDLEGLLGNVDVLIGLWDNVALLSREIDEKFFEKGLAWKYEVDSNPFSKGEWTNFCAFVVRLSIRGVVDKIADAEELFRFVLDQERSVLVLNDNLSAAAVWILYGGGEIHYRSMQGSVPFSLERWSS